MGDTAGFQLMEARIQTVGLEDIDGQAKGFGEVGVGAYYGREVVPGGKALVTGVGEAIYGKGVEDFYTVAQDCIFTEAGVLKVKGVGSEGYSPL